MPCIWAQVQEAVLAALENGRTVFVRRGEHAWRRDMPISLSGNVRIMGEEGAILRGKTVQHNSACQQTEHYTLTH